MVDIQANLALKLDGLQKSTEDVGKQVRDQTAWMMERYRGETFIRMPIVQATGTASLTMGGDASSPIVAPDQGFVWSVRHLVIEGMTAGSTPDVMNIRRGSATGQIVWQLNGNQFAQTWGRGEIILKAGETLFYQAVGTFTSTSLIKAYGSAQQLPGERIGIFG